MQTQNLVKIFSLSHLPRSLTKSGGLLNRFFYGFVGVYICILYICRKFNYEFKII